MPASQHATAMAIPDRPEPGDARAVDARAVDARAVDARAVDARAVDARAGSRQPDCTPAVGSPPGRLKKRAEFLRVAAKGKKAPVTGLVLQALPRHDDEPARLGFTVTKKVGNAVVRNRTRRRLKEAARLLLRERPLAGVDLVLIGRDATRARPFDALCEDLARALKRAGVA